MKKEGSEENKEKKTHNKVEGDQIQPRRRGEKSTNNQQKVGSTSEQGDH